MTELQLEDLLEVGGGRIGATHCDRCDKVHLAVVAVRGPLNVIIPLELSKVQALELAKQLCTAAGATA